MAKEFDFNNKSVVITGASRGIGFGVAKAFVAYSEAKGALGADDWNQYGFGVQYKTPQKIALKAQYWDLTNDTTADTSGLGFSADGEGDSISIMGPISKHTKIGLGYHHSEQTENPAEKISITQLALLHSFSKKTSLKKHILDS